MLSTALKTQCQVLVKPLHCILVSGVMSGTGSSETLSADEDLGSKGKVLRGQQGHCVMVMGWGWDGIHAPVHVHTEVRRQLQLYSFIILQFLLKRGSLTEPGTHFPSRLAGQQAPWILPYACPARISHQSLCPTCSLMRVLGTKLSESSLPTGESAQHLTSHIL